MARSVSDRTWGLMGSHNGGFEVGTGSQTATGPVGNDSYGWFFSEPSSVTISFDNTNFHSGLQSMKLTATSAGTNYGTLGNVPAQALGAPSVANCNSPYAISINPSTTYKISMWYKTANFTVGQGFGYWTTSSLAAAYTNNLTFVSQSSWPTDWTYFEGTFTSGATHVVGFLQFSIGRGANVNNGATIWIDDVKITPIKTRTSASARTAAGARNPVA